MARGEGEDGRTGGLVHHLTLRSGIALVVANIVGAGIFTSTGFQAADLPHPGYIFLLWIVGGVLAFSGALCYGELGAAMPRAGAEYVYLRETYGGMFGFMSAFVSLIAGFSAPIAAVCKAFISYMAHFFPELGGDPAPLGPLAVNDVLAAGLVWILIGLQLRSVRAGIGFNDLLTLLKLIGLIIFILLAVFFGRGQLDNLTFVSERYAEIGTADKLGAFATSLIFVMFCYMGWNAAAYLASEFKEPERDLPRSLLLGTGIVVVLYLSINAVYFLGANVDELAGRVDVGIVASQNLFGNAGVTFVTIVIGAALLTSATAMTIAGPRVYYALGEDYRLFRFFARVNPKSGTPTTSLLVQGAVTTAIIFSGGIDAIQQYAGFTLTLFSALAVSCVIALRIRRPDMHRPFRAWGYPFTPLLFLSITIWTMIWAFRGRPFESAAGLATVAAGGLIFMLSGGGRRPGDRQRG
jgi:basic amino acid/polyamine antiporter, APA family